MAEPADRNIQERVGAWMKATFDEDVQADMIERGHRFIEEALELAQAVGISRHDVEVLMDYVFGRPQGDIGTEVGDVLIVLAALCNAAGVDMSDSADAMLYRNWTNIEKIRAKHNSKQRGTPLPGRGPAEREGP